MPDCEELQLKAQIIPMRGDTVVVITTKGPEDTANYSNDCWNTVITVQGFFSRSMADGIKRMIDEDQCPVCGKFNGLHGEIYNIDSMDNGEVRGHYTMCERGKK
jgi:hypothetical protein